MLSLDFFRKQGSIGGKLGGRISSDNMTPEQRRARALKAVAARKWHPVKSDEEKATEAAQPKNKRGRPRQNANSAPTFSSHVSGEKRTGSSPQSTRKKS